MQMAALYLLFERPFSIIITFKKTFIQKIIPFKSLNEITCSALCQILINKSSSQAKQRVPFFFFF